MSYIAIPAIAFITLIFGATYFGAFTQEQSFGGTADCDAGYTKITYDNPSTQIPSDGFYSDDRNGNYLVGMTTATGTPGMLYVDAKNIQTYIDKGARYVAPVLTDMAVCKSGQTKTEYAITPQEADAFKMQNVKPQR